MVAGARVLLTGATGFLGAHLARRLVAAGCWVGALLRPGSNTARIADLLDRLHPLPGDLLVPESLAAAVHACAPRYVFHLAAHGVDRPLASATASVQTNVQGTVNLLEACRAADLARFVYVGTCYEYGDGGAPCHEDQPVAPANFYAASKAAGGLFCGVYQRVYSLPVVTVRPFQTYGPYQGCRLLLPYAITTALRGADLRLTPGEQVRDFVYVDDVIEGLVAAATAPAAVGQTINLGSGEGTTVRRAVEMALDILGWPVRAHFGALDYRPGEIRDLRADPRRAHELLGWQARTGLADGLQRTVGWYRANLELALRLPSS